jgi:predicted ester cyclase
MSVEQNKNAIRKTMEEIWNKGNLDLIPELFTTDYVSHSQLGADTKGHEGFRQMVTSTRAAFPDYHCAIENLVAEGDKVVCFFTQTGTNTGTFGGIAPTGKKWTSKAMFITTMKDGKSADTWAISNPLVAYSQLGMAPPGYKLAEKK